MYWRGCESTVYSVFHFEECMDFTDCNIGFREHFISYHSTSSLGAGVAGLVNSRQSQGRVACAQCLSVTRRLSAAPVKTRPQAPCHLLAELVPGGSRCCRSAAREQTGGNRMLVTPRVGHVEPARVDCTSFLLKIAEVKLHEKSRGKMLRADAFAGPTLSPLVGHLIGEEFRFFFLSLGEVSMPPLLSASSSWCSGLSWQEENQVVWVTVAIVPCDVGSESSPMEAGLLGASPSSLKAGTFSCCFCPSRPLSPLRLQLPPACPSVRDGEHRGQETIRRRDPGCTTVISDTLFGQRRGVTKRICLGPALAGVQAPVGNEHQHICVLATPLFLEPSLRLCSPKLPGTGASPQGDRHGRGSREDRKRRMVTRKVRGRAGGEASGATDIQAHRQGPPKTTARAADSLGPRGLIISSNVGFLGNT
ncbi:hypothetical protein J1605_010352 [Eschrichtius robustus]|uniref:Uncharacterized protein n=1 Tax=Eschrichtius robustus TaxID=9764 RepID=A0AB34GUK1_ESCRO|nr:hypothetical protein J1605_010352 [Eschrichtius robustus]